MALTSGEAAAMPSAAKAAIRTRAAAGHSATSAIAAIATPMQFRMSTLSIDRQPDSDGENTQFESRNRYPMARIYPARRSRTANRSRGAALRRSRLSIRKANVTPARNRNSTAAMPPTNCDRTYPPLWRKSCLVNELKLWHWIMITTARPRAQSRNGSRFTRNSMISGHPLCPSAHPEIAAGLPEA